MMLLKYIPGIRTKKLKTLNIIIPNSIHMKKKKLFAHIAKQDREKEGTLVLLRQWIYLYCKSFEM